VSDFFDNWVVQVRKGVIELCILRSLSLRERYGYELVRELSEVPGMGLTEGTLYPLLSRLRLSGLVITRLEESATGPARKYYRLTPEGHRTLKTMNSFLETLNRSTQQIGGDRE
jgi:PadR family transcriptional regulator, regulatory protein PadR